VLDGSGITKAHLHGHHPVIDDELSRQEVGACGQRRFPVPTI
jgi:hypothetical protein